MIDSQARDDRIFVQCIEHFIRAWGPEDLYDRSEFEAQLHGIVRQIYRDAQEPLLKQLTTMVLALPFIPLATAHDNVNTQSACSMPKEAGAKGEEVQRRLE
jgi:hypothetical protein